MRYDHITEKPHCCVPAVLQMIQARRGLSIMSQDEIGWELGLIVPAEVKSEFIKVRTGPKPPVGYGTQVSKPQFSIEKYFVRNRLPLSIKRVSATSVSELRSIFVSALDKDDDTVLCLNSLYLFGEGDIEHVFLIEKYNESTGQVTIVDPAIGAPIHRDNAVDSIFVTIKNHNASTISGIWIVSAKTENTTRHSSGHQNAGAA